MITRNHCIAAFVLAAASIASAETCLSPFVKRLDRPEKHLYVFCVDADAKDNDFLAVVDVDPASPTYSTITHKLDLGSAGNETHHFGYTDDRTRIWGCSLFSSRLFLIDVATDPAKPKLVKVIEDVEKQTGFTGPHSPYALPGRMLISFLAGKNGGLPAGLAEFTNDGKFIRKWEMPADAPYGYDVAIKPDADRMVTSAFSPLRNYKKPLAEFDFTDFGSELLLWDFRKREIIGKVKTGPSPLEVRWSVKPQGRHGFTNCLLEHSIWMFQLDAEGRFSSRKAFDCGKLPADLRQSADDKFLFVSCFGSDEIQMWDVSDLKAPKLTSTLKPGVHPNMMHLTGDDKRMYITNSLLSTADRTQDFWIKLARVTPEGMKLDDKFLVDLTKLPTGPARGHDMLLN